jgi:hypothetical protein
VRASPKRPAGTSTATYEGSVVTSLRGTEAAEERSSQGSEECETWFQPVGNNWQPFLPGSIIPEFSLFVETICMSDPDYAVVGFDPRRILVGRKVDGDCRVDSSEITRVQFDHTNAIKCKILFEEMSEENSPNLFFLAMHHSLLTNKCIVLSVPKNSGTSNLSDQELPIISPMHLFRHKTAVSKEMNSSFPTSKPHLWFQPVGNNWQPFLPRSILPEFSLFVETVCMSDPDYAVVGFDPRRILVGRKVDRDCRKDSAEITHVQFDHTNTIKCKILFEEMSEENSPNLFILAMHHSLLTNKCIVLSVPKNSGTSNLSDQELPIISPMHLFRHKIAESKEINFDGEAGNSFDTSEAGFQPEDPFEDNGDDCFEDNGNDVELPLPHSLQLGRPAFSRLSYSGMCAKRQSGSAILLSNYPSQHFSLGGRTLERPLKLNLPTNNNKQHNRPEGNRKTVVKKKVIRHKPAPANREELVRHNQEKRDKQNNMRRLAKIEECENIARARWMWLFGERELDPINLQDKETSILEKTGLSRECYHSLVDPGNRVRGSVIDAFFKMLSDQHPAKIGYLKAAIVPTFRNSTDKETGEFFEQGMCLGMSLCAAHGSLSIESNAHQFQRTRKTSFPIPARYLSI